MAALTRKPSPEGRREDLSACGGGRAAGVKTARLVLALCCSLLLTACPPDGGDLVPVAGGEGAELVTTRFEGDTLRVSRGGATAKARGLWSVADASTSVILEVSNANAEELTLDLARAELLAGDGKQRLSLRSVSDESAPGGPAAFLREKRVTVGAGQQRTFALEFKMDSGDGRSGVPRDVSGQTATLRIPAEVESATPVAVEFVFDFKYSEHQRRP